MTVQKHIPDDYMPILSIMVRPRDAFNYALQDKKFSYALYAGAVGGFASSLAALYGSKYPYGYSVGQLVYSSFVTGVLIIMITNLLMALLFRYVGAVFNGQGSFKKLFQTMCLVTIPYIWLMPIVLFWMGLSPQSFFNMSDTLTLGEAIWSYVGSFAILIASVWVFVLSLVGISEAHSFSKWKAFFVLTISSFVVVLILGAIRLF